MKCICGDIFQIDFDFRTSYHIAHCLKCNKKIINKSYFQLFKKLKENIIEEDEIAQYEYINVINNIRKNQEIQQSYQELTTNNAQYVDELSADFLELAFSYYVY